MLWVLGSLVRDLEDLTGKEKMLGKGCRAWEGALPVSPQAPVSGMPRAWGVSCLKGLFLEMVGAGDQG